MKKYTNLIVLLSILAVLIAGFGYMTYTSGRSTKEDKKETIASSKKSESLVNQRLPEFSMKTTSGEVVDSSKFSGKPMLIMEWASWCPYCQKTLPVVNELYGKYKDDLQFVMLNALDGERETAEKANKYVSEKKYDFTYYFDENLAAADKLKVETIPTLIFVDADGKVQKVGDSTLTQEEMEKTIQSLL